jgi:CcmD family protein
MKRTRTVVLALAVAWLMAAGAGLGRAQGAPAAQPPAALAQPASPEPQEQFVPVKTLPQQEQLPAATLVMTAYGFVWAVLLVYLWTIWRRLMKVEREMHDLAARLGEKR